MTGLASRFFASAIIYGVLGMALGLFMGMTEDHAQMPTHAHVMLIGWVSFAIYAFFYHTFPSAAASRLAPVHFWLAQAGFLTLITGLFMIFGGRPSAGPIAGIGSMAFLASMILFGVIAWPTMMGKR